MTKCRRFRLWQADIVTANEEQQTFTVFIINTRKTVSGVPASHIRKRQRGSAAVRGADVANCVLPPLLLMNTDSVCRVCQRRSVCPT